jgi:hypothetical protein
MSFQPPTKEERAAEFEGDQAMRAGKSWSANPYPKGTPLHQAWHNGYASALKEYSDTW